MKYKDNWNVDAMLVNVSGGFETVSCNANGNVHKLVWHAPLDAGKYQLVLDMDYYGSGVYSKIPDYVESVYDPLWAFTVTGDEPEPIPEFSIIAIPVASVLGLLFLFNYRKRRRKE